MKSGSGTPRASSQHIVIGADSQPAGGGAGHCYNGPPRRDEIEVSEEEFEQTSAVTNLRSLA